MGQVEGAARELIVLGAKNTHRTWCSTRPSRALKPTTSFQFCHSTSLPSTLNDGPSGCVIWMGLIPGRSGPTRSGE